MAGPVRAVELVVAAQDGGDGGGGRQRLDALAGQQHTQLAAAPGGVLRAQRQDRLLDGRGGLRRTAVRSPRAVPQPRRALGRVAPQPLVPRGRRDLKALAQFRPVGARLAGQRHKLGPQIAHPSLRKRHIPDFHLSTGCVNHVSEHV